MGKNVFNYNTNTIQVNARNGVSVERTLRYRNGVSVVLTLRCRNEVSVKRTLRGAYGAILYISTNLGTRYGYSSVYRGHRAKLGILST